MGAGVIQILSLEQDLRSTQVTTQAFGMVDRGWATDIVLEVPIKFREELRVLHVPLIRQSELINGLHEGFSDEYTPVGPKVASLIRVVVSRGSACFDSQIPVPR